MSRFRWMLVLMTLAWVAWGVAAITLRARQSHDPEVVVLPPTTQIGYRQDCRVVPVGPVARPPQPGDLLNRYTRQGDNA
jgi:hypothetical protein